MRMADSVLLTCWPPAPLRPHGVDLQVRIVDGDVDLLGLGQHRHGGGRGVDAAGGFRIGHALDAVDAALEFQAGEDVAALDLGDDFLVAAGRAFAFGHDLDLPALQVGVARIHAEQVAGEERRLVAAGAGANFEDGALLVRLVAGQQHDAQILRRLGPQPRAPRGNSSSTRARISESVPGSAEQRLQAARFSSMA